MIFEEKYEDTLRSSMLLLKKNNVLQFEISTLKGIMSSNFVNGIRDNSNNKNS